MFHYANKMYISLLMLMGLSATQLRVCRFLKKNVKLNVFENRQEKGNSKTRLKHADCLNILSC